MPGAKNGERPYLAVPEPTFLGAIFGRFLTSPHAVSDLLLHNRSHISILHSNTPHTQRCN